MCRWLALGGRNWRRRRNPGHADQQAPTRTTVLLEVEPNDGLPFATIASYLDRYGIRCAGVRVTFAGGDRAAWISLTIDATDNLAPLLARSPDMPLQQTAQVVARRLAAHLREQGQAVQTVQPSDVAWPAVQSERWRGARVEGGYVACYRVRVDDALPETLAAIRAYPALRTWAVVEMTGDPAHPAVSAGCALLTADKPTTKSPVDGLAACSGDHGPALVALNPASTVLLAERQGWRPTRFDDVDALQSPRCAAIA